MLSPNTQARDIIRGCIVLVIMLGDIILWHTIRGTLSPDVNWIIVGILFYTIMAGHIIQVRYCPVYSDMDTVNMFW